MVELHGAGGAACRRGMAFFIMFSLLLTLTVHVHVRVPPFHCDAEFCDKFDSELTRRMPSSPSGRMRHSAAQVRLSRRLRPRAAELHAGVRRRGEREDGLVQHALQALAHRPHVHARGQAAHEGE